MMQTLHITSQGQFKRQVTLPKSSVHKGKVISFSPSSERTMRFWAQILSCVGKSMDDNIFKIFSSFFTSSPLLTFLPPIPPSSHTNLPSNTPAILDSFSGRSLPSGWCYYSSQVGMKWMDSFFNVRQG